MGKAYVVDARGRHSQGRGSHAARGCLSQPPDVAAIPVTIDSFQGRYERHFHPFTHALASPGSAGVANSLFVVLSKYVLGPRPH